jgi:hypothetical protein
MAEIFEGFVTKYALTSGIQKLQMRAIGADGAGDVAVRFMSYFHGEGREWHRTWESALVRAEEMRKAKLASMRKSMAKIEALKFEEPK